MKHDRGHFSDVIEKVMKIKYDNEPLKGLDNHAHGFENNKRENDTNDSTTL